MIESVRVASRGRVDALVLAQFRCDKLDTISAKLDPSGSAAAAARRHEASGELGSIVTAFPPDGPGRILIVGLGDKDTFETGRLRAVGGVVTRACDAAKLDNIEIAFDGAFGSIKSAVDEHAAGGAMGEGLALGAWDTKVCRGSKSDADKPAKLSVRAKDRDFSAGLKRGIALGQSANITRRLSQTPPNIATTNYMAGEARKLARDFDSIKCTIIKGQKLAQQRMTGHINVGKASENEPMLIRLEYTPPRPPKNKKPAVFVGKTITYDTGGLSIKPSNSMKGMKRDKDGGCAALGAMHAIASVIKPKRRVVALLATAENSISDEAYRPDDVLEFRNGVTVEVTNTDAEGRLVLADGLCWACDKEDPAFIIDMATLTGGVVVALGSVRAGLFCDDEDLRGKLEAASAASGERLWRLPMDEEYDALMKSPVADIVNSSSVRGAHAIQGAVFLRNFVKPGIPWAHIDIAGVDEADKPTGPFPAGPTGFGTRLLAELLSQ